MAVNFLRLNSDYDNKLFQNRRSKITAKLNKATRNISSGLKLQTAADDPAGLAVSEKPELKLGDQHNLNVICKTAWPVLKNSGRRTNED